MAVQPRIIGPLSEAAQIYINGLSLPEESRAQLEADIVLLTRQIDQLSSDPRFVRLPQDADAPIREVWNRAQEIIKESIVQDWSQRTNEVWQEQEQEGFVFPVIERFPNYGMRNFQHYVMNRLIPFTANEVAKAYLGKALLWHVNIASDLEARGEIPNYSAHVEDLFYQIRLCLDNPLFVFQEHPQAQQQQRRGQPQ